MDTETFTRLLLALALLSLGFLVGVFAASVWWLDDVARRAYNAGHDETVARCVRWIEEQGERRDA